MTPLGIASRATYDALGRVAATTLDSENGAASGADGTDDVKSRFAYDSIGEQTGYCPDNAVYGLSCNPATGSDTSAGRLRSVVTPWSATATTTWNLDGTIAGRKWAGETSALADTHDAAKRPTGAAKSTVVSMTQTYTARTTSRAATAPSPGPASLATLRAAPRPTPTIASSASSARPASRPPRPDRRAIASLAGYHPGGSLPRAKVACQSCRLAL